MGAWLNRKARNLEAKRAEALRMIAEAGEAGQDPSVIREEWAAQVREQTKPAPSASPPTLQSPANAGGRAK